VIVENNPCFLVLEICTVEGFILKFVATLHIQKCNHRFRRIVFYAINIIVFFCLVCIVVKRVADKLWAID